MQTIVSELSQCLDQWPSDRHFSVDQVLAAHPEFRDDSLAIEQIVLEEYVRRLESGERINPSTFCDRYSSLSPALTRQLRNLAELHSRHCLLNKDAELAWQFPNAGDEVNGYTLVEEIGRGAFSRVFLAKDGHVADRQVVVKTTYHGCAEIELLGPMSHPHLPRIFYCQRDPQTGITTICMDWIGQRTLNDLIAEIHFPEPGSRPHPVQSVAKAIEVIGQVADGLAYAHQHNVLHLDVKPSNILLRDDGTAVLIDFNLATTVSQSQDVGFRGTLAYAAPEVIAMAVPASQAPQSPLAPATEAADVYSLGTVFYELLTGDLPFPDVPSGPIEVAARAAWEMKQQPVARPSEINPAIDAALDQIITTALAPCAEDRYSSAQEFYTALQAYASPRPQSSRQRPLVLALCIAVITLTVFFSGSHGTVHSVSRPEARPENQSGAVPASINRPPSIDQPSTVGRDHDLIAGWRKLLAGDPDSALNVFESASQTADDPRLVASEAYALMMQNRFADSGDRFFSVIRELPNDFGVAFSYAYCCLRARRQLSAAQRTLSIVSASDDNHELGLFLRALVDVQLDKSSTGTSVYLDRLRELNTASSNQLAEAVSEYGVSQEPDIIDAHLAWIAESSNWPAATVDNPVIVSLLPDYLDPLIQSIRERP